MTATEPVKDWATDYDLFAHEYVVEPYPIWDDLRERCPVAHTDRLGGSWLPTRYEDVCAFARNPQAFSSRSVTVFPPVDSGNAAYDAVGAPPISSDPPEHTWARRLILPAFAPRVVETYEPITRDLCRRLVNGFVERGRADAARDYAQQIPVRIIGQMLGVPLEMADTFVGWVRGVLELGATDVELRLESRNALITFLIGQLEARRAQPTDDLISQLMAAEVDGEPVPPHHIIGTCFLLVVAGIDTTWSSIGSALWHLATHPEDRARLVAEPELIPTAVEELLRAYSPVTMARVANEDVEFAGVHIKEGERVILNFPAANRDPAVFEDADKVIIDRQVNRHVAFGAGIHRCAGSNLARMELRVAIEEWLARIPEFTLADGGEVTWAGGQVRGPRECPVVWPTPVRS
jgi:cytochrome P450